MRKAAATQVTIPSSCTSAVKLQPLDVGVNEPFKTGIHTVRINYVTDEGKKAT